MDFLKILKSFEEFVYEALSWLILLPMTMIRIAAHPLKMSAYAAAEVERVDDKRFDNAVSPPLLLILCVLLAHLIDLAVREQDPQTSGALAKAIFTSEQNLLLYRTLAFGIWALVSSACLLIITRRAVGRENLRGPFYQQCYLVSPFALLLSVSVSFNQFGPSAARIAACVVIASTIWFWLVQIGWIRQRSQLAFAPAILAATGIVLVGFAINAAVGYVILQGHV